MTEIEKKLRNVEAQRRWRRNRPEKANAAHKRWVYKNKEKVSQANKEWREKNKKLHLGRRRENQKIRRETDPLFKFSQNLRILIGTSFKRANNFKKKLKTEEILGCSLSFFVNYITSINNSKVEEFGRYGYHIDHIIPISTARTEEEIIKLCHYTNLQPLWWKENLSKSNKIN